jgi:tRNA1Val (adenine37-N6)-methyltransferase
LSAYSKTEFRGWTIPGPIPPGARTGQPALEPGETLDAISGHFRIFQLENGHRFSTDDLLTAWYGSTWAPAARAVLDLGSGIGTVALVTAWRLPGARFVTVEAQPESVRLARKSVAWNGLEDRCDLRQGDFRDPSLFAPEEKFDLVLGSPPYFPPGSGIEGDHPQKIACRFEMRGNIADYCTAAAQRLAPGGWFACVFPISPPQQHQRLLAAAQAAQLAIIRMRPIILRQGEPPLLGLFAMIRAGDLPSPIRQLTWTEPPLTIRQADRSIHPEYAAIKLSFGFPP